MAFVETLHIFIGKDNHFFTLRQSYQHAIYSAPNCNGQYNVRLETRYDHLCNLSQDYKEARAKAVEYSERLGIPLVAAENNEEQLKEINRRTAADIEAAKQEYDRACAIRVAEEHALKLSSFNSWKEEALRTLNDGVFPYDAGQYSGKPLEFIPVTYLQWILSMIDVKAEMNKFAFIADIIQQFVSIPEVKESEYVGTIKERIDIEVQVQRSLTFEGTYGTTFMYSMIDKTGNDLVWFTSKPVLHQKNGWFAIKATVKSHEVYRGKKQTALTRAKVL